MLGRYGEVVWVKTSENKFSIDEVSTEIKITFVAIPFIHVVTYIVVAATIC